ncbi:MAG: hypothetical protein KatS3mg103_0246 [Phycisphaerales bacterium]|nr:MAG: hypothetical protein KatS3mg103_0246 [Phycisphaerales bacterium]
MSSAGSLPARDRMPLSTCGRVMMVGPMSKVKPASWRTFIFPPRWLLDSTMVTGRPLAASSTAQASPASPPPTMATPCC